MTVSRMKSVVLPDKELNLDGLVPPLLVKLHQRLTKKSKLLKLHLKHDHMSNWMINQAVILHAMMQGHGVLKTCTDLRCNVATRGELSRTLSQIHVEQTQNELSRQ